MYQKIYIVGPVGSGKSTLARRISKITGIPCYHLDNVVHTPDPSSRWGNRKRPEAQRDTLFHRILSARRYIIEDTGRPCFAMGLEEADVVLSLEYPPPLRQTRILLRWVRQNLGMEPCQYRPNLRMLRYMFRWAKQYDTGADGTKARIAGYPEKTVILQNNQELETFLLSLRLSRLQGL